MQPSQEVLRQILEYLWQRHIAAEHQYAYWILLSPLVALTLFLVLWYKHRAHAPSLLEAISFFFSPRGPERMLIFKDLMGNRYLVYNYRVVKGSKGFIVQAGPFTLKTSEDPESYAEPVNLVDARGPPGIPSPFGLFVRQLIGAYVMLSLVVVSFANTMWTTWSVYSKIGYSFTSVDLLSFAALVIALAWFIATLLKSLSPQTLVISLSAIGMSEGYIEASPALDVYSSFPPAKLLRSIAREPKIVVSEGVKDTVEKLEREVGDRSLAASMLALLGQVYDTWRRSLGILLQDRYDISVAARAKYHLEEVKIPRGFLSRYAGVLALIAIFLVIGLAILWLHPTVQPATVNATATMPSPASPPPPPPTHTATATATPAPAPPPPGGG